MSKGKEFILTGDDKQANVIDKGSITRYDTIIPAFYNVTQVFGTPVTHKADIQLPKGSELTAKLILDTHEITELFSEHSLDIHTQLNIKAKIGYILEGPQGTGKTTAMLAVGKKLIDTMGACVFIVEEIDALQASFKVIKEFRLLNPDILAVVLFDECEAYMQGYEADMKRLLDGTDTPTKFIFIGATNYIEKIPEAIKNRPSRIKHVFECKDLLQDESIVWTMLNNLNINLTDKVRLSDDQVREMVLPMKSKTIDEIKHCFLDKLISTKPEKEAPKPKTRKKTGPVATEELN